MLPDPAFVAGGIHTEAGWGGGGGFAWLRDRVHRFRHVTEVLLDAGYACAWSRYRTEVELGYQTGVRSTEVCSGRAWRPSRPRTRS